jgi:hypothetical protein
VPVRLATLPVTGFQRDRRISPPEVEAGKREAPCRAPRQRYPARARWDEGAAQARPHAGRPPAGRSSAGSPQVLTERPGHVCSLIRGPHYLRHRRGRNCSPSWAGEYFFGISPTSTRSPCCRMTCRTAHEPRADEQTQTTGSRPWLFAHNRPLRRMLFRLRASAGRLALVAPEGQEHQGGRACVGTGVQDDDAQLEGAKPSRHDGTTSGGGER